MVSRLTSSVVIATYNALAYEKNYFQKQLDSIFSQTVLPDEIIFTDDCSTDETVAFIKDIKTRYQNSISIKVLQREKNIGFVNNFFDGIKISQGDVIFTCDQDDLWEADKIAVTMRYFEQYSDMSAYHSGYDVIDGSDKLLTPVSTFYPERTKELQHVDFRFFLKSIHYAGMALAFRSTLKPFIEKVINSLPNIHTHDWLICYLAALSDGLYLNNQILTHRRFTGSNVALGQGSFQDIKKTPESRITDVKLLLEAYRFLDQFQEKFPEYKRMDIKKFIQTQENRILYCANTSLWGLLKNLPNICYYSRPRQFIGDLMALFNK